MPSSSLTLRALSLVLMSAAALPASATEAPSAPRSSTKPGTFMTQHASGSFDVKLPTLKLDDAEAPESLGRKGIDKQFHGDLEASSRGEMLFAGTDTPGSAGYVAIERVTGTLHGRRGSFVLQHFATMTRGAPMLKVIVVPDSGTDELKGLSGALDIQITEGKHFYTFDYTLAP